MALRLVAGPFGRKRLHPERAVQTFDFRQVDTGEEAHRIDTEFARMPVETGVVRESRSGKLRSDVTQVVVLARRCILLGNTPQHVEETVIGLQLDPQVQWRGETSVRILDFGSWPAHREKG